MQPSNKRTGKSKKILPSLSSQSGKHNIPLNYLDSLTNHHQLISANQGYFAAAAAPSSAMIPIHHEAMMPMPIHPAAYFMNPLAHYWPLLGQQHYSPPLSSESINILHNVISIEILLFSNDKIIGSH